MDRKVIVLSPSEWEKRMELGEAMQNGYNHSHFAVTKEATIQSILWGLKKDIEKGNRTTTELLSTVEKAIEYSGKITTEIRQVQNYIGNVATMIDYKIEQEKENS